MKNSLLNEMRTMQQLNLKAIQDLNKNHVIIIRSSIYPGACNKVFDIVKNASKFGIEIPEYTVKWSKVIKRSRDVSRRLNKGIEFLMKKNKVTYIPARGKLIDATTLQTTTSEGLEYRNIIK